MNVFDSIILGIIQGLAEFLPISSSGHLIIARDLFNWHGSTDLAFDAVLQLATILALICYFHKDIWHLIKAFYLMVKRESINQKDKILLWAIILGTLPAIVFGILLETYMETTFRSAVLVSVVLIIGSIVMFIAEKFAPQNKELTIEKGIKIGFFQCLALVPGFSRSGATISGGLLLGLARDEAARFSFLLSIPIILGSGLKKFIEIMQAGAGETNTTNLLLGSVTAFIVGYFAIEFLLKFLKKHTLHIFIYYRVILATAVLSFLLLK